MPYSKFTFQSRRSPVFSTRGIVAASQPLAAQAGALILEKGGNAADAAVATAAALNVTEPGSTGLGGDCFALFYDNAMGHITALNGSGHAPKQLTLKLLASQGLEKELPTCHPHTVTVPGACAGWCDLIERHGTMTMSEILAPAIRLAENGFPVAPITANLWQASEKKLLESSPGGRELTVDGRAPRVGEVFRNPTLARTLTLIAQQGHRVFYEGEIAERIVGTLSPLGSVMTLDDLAEHESTWDEPISTVFEGIRIHECPPNGQGITALIALNILSECGLDALGEPLASTRLHYVIESLRLAFADTRYYVADPRCTRVPIDQLLSCDYARERAQLIQPERANLSIAKGYPFSSSDTVYLSVVDGKGNACSFINSNYMAFGTGIVPEGLGFALQNRGHNFSLEHSHPNALAPGKRPYHTIIPAMATREQDGSLYACFGVMGGFMQPQGHVQVVLGLVQDGLNPQDALDRPRLCIEGGTPAGEVAVEEGIDANVFRELSSMGHQVRMVSGYDRSLFGRGQIILRDPLTGVLCAGSDPRADGCAIGV